MNDKMNGRNGKDYDLPEPLLSTKALHADDPDHSNGNSHPIAPDMQLSTTFRTPGPDSEEGLLLEKIGEAGLNWQSPPVHIYSRYTSETRSRVEKVLSEILEAHALIYASGLTAAYAAILHYSPKVIAIRKGYHGVHSGIEIYKRSHDVQIIDLDDDYPTLESRNRNGTSIGGLLVWVESPLNPTSEARNIKYYADRAHAVGASLAIDSTFAPLQRTFDFGADLVMHSATKYFGGHSDLLAGILAVKAKTEWDQLFNDRTYIGGMPGNFEAWLLLRSIRTLNVRWKQQSQTALKLANWLQSLVQEAKIQSKDTEDKEIIAQKVVTRVWHASFQPRQDVDQARPPRFDEGKGFDPSEQMKEGWPATFAIRMSNRDMAHRLPHKTQYFAAATSLGGVESLLEHRIAADPTEDPALIRLSVGLEDFEDLRADLRNAFRSVM